MKTHQKNKGFIALLTVIIVSAAVLVMAIGSSFLGLGELDNAVTNSGGSKAFFITDGCTEEALRRIRLDTSYAGGNLDIENGSCIIDVTPVGNQREVIVSASSNEGYSNLIIVNLTLAGNVIAVDSWKQIEN